MLEATAVQREQARAEFTIQTARMHLTFQATVPAGPTRARELLPLARALCDAVVGETQRALEEAGEKISCTKGCAACCCNLVAVSQPEARRLADLLAELPEPRRSALRERFALAHQRLGRAGLLEKLRASEQWTPADYAGLVGAYFAQGIPCPFLEHDSCSIYDERPLACREYLVTSPAEHCARLGSQGVRLVAMPLRMFNAVARWQLPPQGHFEEHWVPLVMAPEWAAAHPDEPVAEPGLALLRQLLDMLDTQVPTPTAAAAAGNE